MIPTLPLALCCSFVLAMASTCGGKPHVKHKVVHHHKTEKSVKKNSPKTHLVDSEWVKNYKKSEAEHGDYSINADNQIKPEGVKFRVPQAVVDHNSDLVQTPPD
jgi:hypothetical protein